MGAARGGVWVGRAGGRGAGGIGERRSALYQQGGARGEDRSAVVDRSHWGAARGSGALGARGEQNWSGATVAAGGGGRAELSSADRSKLGDHRQHGHRT